MRHVAIGIVLGFLAVGVLAACSANQSSSKTPYLTPESEPAQEPAAGPTPECVDEDNEPVKCSEDSDCCEGFICGKDPELNHRETFCIFAG